MSLHLDLRVPVTPAAQVQAQHETSAIEASRLGREQFLSRRLIRGMGPLMTGTKSFEKVLAANRLVRRLVYV